MTTSVKALVVTVGTMLLTFSAAGAGYNLIHIAASHGDMSEYANEAGGTVNAAAALSSGTDWVFETVANPVRARDSAVPLTAHSPIDAATSVGGDLANSFNTGVPAGIQLTPSEAIEVNTPGAVISGLDITGYVHINAPNVTVRNVRVNATTWGAIIVTAKGGGVLLEDSEIFSTYAAGGSKGVTFDGTSGGAVLRCNIHNVEDGIYIQGDHFLIQDNYIHDSESNSSDPHSDGVQISADTRHVVLKHNNVAYDNTTNSSFTIGNNEGPVDDLRLEDNRFTGGGYTVRCDGRGSHPMTNITIINNRIARGAYGYVAFDGICRPTFAGNVDDVRRTPLR